MKGDSGHTNIVRLPVPQGVVMDVVSPSYVSDTLAGMAGGPPAVVPEPGAVAPTKEEEFSEGDRVLAELAESEAVRYYVQDRILALCEDRAVLAARWAASKARKQASYGCPDSCVCPRVVPLIVSVFKTKP